METNKSPIDIFEEFSKTKSLYEEFKESSGSVFRTYELDKEDYEPSNEIAYEEWEINELYKISQVFKKEYQSYVVNKLFFFGCPINIYKIHYYKRMYDYFEKTGVNEEIYFIESELKRGLLDFDYNFLEDDLQTIIDESLKHRYKFLTNQLIQYNSEIIEVNTDYGFEIVKSTNNSSESDEEDLEDEIGITTPKERILYLNETGVLKYLKEFDSVTRSSTNKLSELLGYITGLKSGTIQSYINPIISQRVSQNNSPYKNENNVSKVRSVLTSKIGIELKDEYTKHF